MSQQRLLRCLAATVLTCCAALAYAQSTTASATTSATTKSSGALMDFGMEGLGIVPVKVVNGHTARTAQLLGEAYRRHDPSAAQRAQYVAELGLVALPEGAAYVIDAMKDVSPLVRAEAARSARAIGDASLLAPVEMLLKDENPQVRREAVMSAAALARAMNKATAAIERGLADNDASVIVAALQSAWTAKDAEAIAAKLPGFPKELWSDAADALGRMKASAQAAAVLPLLQGDVAQRVSVLRALRALANSATGGAVTALLADAHPTVRREAIAAVGAIAAPQAREAAAVKLLADEDPTVREAAARVLTPLPSEPALAAIVGQLVSDYPPLHEALLASMIHPAGDSVKHKVIERAAALLSDANPRRRQDGSYVLGHLRSSAAIDQHVALLTWDPADPTSADWPMIAQAAESLGRLGDAQAIDPLMKLVKPAPEAAIALQRPQRDEMSRAMANALVSLARLQHREAMAAAAHILQTDPVECPHPMRWAAAFAIGALGQQGGTERNADRLQRVYDSLYEDVQTKFEALKGLGNLKHVPAADRLKEIGETDSTPELRWIAHWSYDRVSGKTTPYTAPSEKREPPVSITDLTR